MSNSKELIQQLIESLLLRPSGLEELIQIGKPAVWPLIQALSKYEDAILRSWIIWVLGKIGDERAIPELDRALRHEEYIVRSRAAEALANIGAIDALNYALSDENPVVRNLAKLMLTQLEEQSEQRQLYAVASVNSEDGDIVFLYKEYVVQTGIAPTQLEGFESIGFDMPSDEIEDVLEFSILFHENDHIALLDEGTARMLRYSYSEAQPVFVEFHFRPIIEGSFLLKVDFFHQSRWLRTIRFQLEGVDEKQQILATS